MKTNPGDVTIKTNPGDVTIGAPPAEINIETPPASLSGGDPVETIAYINRMLETYRHEEDELDQNQRAYTIERARLESRHQDLQRPLAARLKALTDAIEGVSDGLGLDAKNRSRKVHNGCVGWRKAPDRIQIIDEEELKYWCLSDKNRTAGAEDLLRRKTEGDKKAIMKWIKTEGEVPDGVELVEGTDRFFVQIDRFEPATMPAGGPK